MNEKKSTHGGKRAGAGRHKQVPEDATRKSIYLTELEYEQIKQFIKELRTK